MIWDKAKIRLFYLIIKEHCKTISLGIRGISLYMPWIINALRGVLIKSLLLFLLIIGPIAELILASIIILSIIAFLT